MILLDTNVISEALRPRPDPCVDSWLKQQNPEGLYISTIALAEMRFGIAILPEGRKKDVLHHGLEMKIVPFFIGRILAFDQSASASYALLRAHARTQGLAVAPADAYIAAIAHTHGMTVATRDVAPFLAMALPVINPWEHGNMG